MGAKTIAVSLPEDCVRALDEAATHEQRSRSDVVRRALEDYLVNGRDDLQRRQELVLELLRSAAITAAQAAVLLNVTRWEIVDLMAAHDIPMADGDAESLREEVETLAKTRGDAR